MEQKYATRLRYLDAADVEDSVVDFDGLDVKDRSGEKLGDIDGFIVDPELSRVHYAVVDSGGWFTSRRFLLPIGEATIDRADGSMRVDLTRESLRSYPEFDESRFRAFDDGELRAFEERIGAVCWPEEQLGGAPTGAAYYESSRHYAAPEWWRGSSWSREQLMPIDSRSYEARAPRTPTDASSTRSPVAARSAREERSARDEESRAMRDERELVTARERGEESPHYGGRAQPGDVLGLETGGETTGVGDTAEDENRRREAAEKARRNRD
jgi:hypothetical protein